MTVITARQYKTIVVLTGSGISAGSGLPTFRGPGGLWNESGTAEMSTAESFNSDPRSSWNFWGELRIQAALAKPNKAHTALAQWESQLTKDQRFTPITQNIDELHQRAGSSRVVELHGSILRSRCSNAKCSLATYRDAQTHINEIPICPNCSCILRPDIVLFGEMLPAESEWSAKRALRDCELFIAIGTSGTVSPACRFVEWDKYAQARTILVNLEKMSPSNPAFDEEILGQAEDILPSLLK